MLGKFRTDLGVDLGTANTLVYLKGKGVVLNEPSVVAVDQDTREVLAVGDEAKRMVGRTPLNIQAVRPMKDGVIADFDVTERMMRHFLTRAIRRRSLLAPRVIVAVPSGVTEVEKRAVIDATLSAGAREAQLIEEPMAAAIGAGLPVQDPTGNMIVDIGGGTTEVAVISLGGMVSHESLRIAGDEMDEAIIQFVRREYNILIGDSTAEQVKREIGTALASDPPGKMEMRGRDLVTGLPKTLTISSDEVREALEDPISAILDSVKRTLERTPPELAADIVDRGIVLAGGGSLLRSLDRRMAEETGMPVHLAEDPLSCVAMGTGVALEHYDLMRRVLIQSKRLTG